MCNIKRYCLHVHVMFCLGICTCTNTKLVFQLWNDVLMTHHKSLWKSHTAVLFQIHQKESTPRFHGGNPLFSPCFLYPQKVSFDQPLAEGFVSFIRAPPTNVHHGHHDPNISNTSWTPLEQTCPTSLPSHLTWFLFHKTFQNLLSANNGYPFLNLNAHVTFSTGSVELPKCRELPQKCLHGQGIQTCSFSLWNRRNPEMWPVFPSKNCHLEVKYPSVSSQMLSKSPASIPTPGVSPGIHWPCASCSGSGGKRLWRNFIIWAHHWRNSKNNIWKV